MQVSYGPPGAKGVTQLMAVGAAELEQNATDQAVRVGGMISVGVFALGLVMRSKAIKNAGLGAAIALWGVRLVTGGGTSVHVTQAQPSPSGRY